MPFVSGGSGAGDCVDVFSDLMGPVSGDPEWPLLVGRVPSAGSTCEFEREIPFVRTGGRGAGCCPFTPACTIRRCRASESLSTDTPGAGELRC